MLCSARKCSCGPLSCDTVQYTWGFTICESSQPLVTSERLTPTPPSDSCACCSGLYSHRGLCDVTHLLTQFPAPQKRHTHARTTPGVHTRLPSSLAFPCLTLLPALAVIGLSQRGSQGKPMVKGLSSAQGPV